MALQKINKKSAPVLKEVKYLNKNFLDFRQSLIGLSKGYYPNTYTDFNEASPGMMFIEMASYVGDVLSFYIDNTFKENLLAYAEERNNIISIAQSLGFKPRLTSPSVCDATLFQIVPATAGLEPDDDYLLHVDVNGTFYSATTPQVLFRNIDVIDFADPADREVTVYARDGITQEPTFFLVSKKMRLVSSVIKTVQVSVTDAEKFLTVTLGDSNVISVISVVDSEGNPWHEVDFLAQDFVFDDTTPTIYTSEPGVPPLYRAQLKTAPRRFVTRISDTGNFQLMFGSGTGTVSSELTNIDPRHIANRWYSTNLANTSLNDINFLESDAFGVAPANTTLTITYAIGGGVESNVPSNSIVYVASINVLNDTTDMSAAQRSILNTAIQSVAVNNDMPATGGAAAPSVEEIRQNSLGWFNAQNRVVTYRDYVTRTLGMPAKYGSVAKAFAIKDDQINKVITSDVSTRTENTDQNPYNNVSYVNDPVRPNAVNLYVLGYNSNKKLTTLNTAVKENLALYLDQYRVLTDEINILDAFVVNIGVEFEILVFKNFIMRDVLARCIDAIDQYFNIDYWQIQQPIILNDIVLQIAAVEGVQSVKNLKIFNRYKFKDGLDYQNYRYDIDEATIDGIVYPSLDPCVFEIRYPERDIIGHATQ